MGVVHKNKVKISNPTADAAIGIVDKYTRLFNQHILEIGKIDTQIAQMHDTIHTMHRNGVLDLREFETIHCFFFKGMSNDEVAEKIKWSIESVFKIKRTAIEKISEKLRNVKDDKAS